MRRALAYPLIKVFSAWLEAVDLHTLTGDIFKLLMATNEYNAAGCIRKNTA